MDLLTWCEAVGAKIAITGSIDPRAGTRSFSASLTLSGAAMLPPGAKEHTGPGSVLHKGDADNIDAAIAKLAAAVSDQELAVGSVSIKCPPLTYQPPKLLPAPRVGKAKIKTLDDLPGNPTPKTQG